MISIRRILDKVIPKLQALEENPTVTIMRMSQTPSGNPFATEAKLSYDETYIVPAVYSETPEIVTNANNITTQQSLFLYIKESDAPGELTLRDRFIFNKKRYKPVEVQNLFGLWKIKIVKE